MGLRKILVISILSGISFGFSFRISEDISEGSLGFRLIDLIFQNVDSSTQFLTIIISLGVTIFSIYGLVKLFKQIYERKISGLVTAILGFSGSLLVIASPQDNSHLIILGIGFWIIAGIISNLPNKKK